MSKLKLGLLNVIALFIACISSFAQAATIIIESPAPREMIVIPAGYIHCKVIPAGIHHGRYIDTHRICYAPRGHVQWVSGHWECTKFNAHKGTCRSWVWVPSYWKGKH